MKSIIFTLALMLPIAVNAQRVRYACNDDVYPTREYVGMYDEVINENRTVKNVMVNHNKEINYYHKNNVVVRHYNLDGCPITYDYEPYCRYQYEEFCPQFDVCDEYVCDEANVWHLYYNHYTCTLVNANALKKLIRFALSNPHLDLYIEAYSDNDARNKRLSIERTKRIFNRLYDNGISWDRLHRMNYVCSKKVYEMNNYNSYITVTAKYRK